RNDHLPNIKRAIKNGLCYSASRAGVMPVVRKLFAGRATIIMFHEIQRDWRSELMTGTPVPLFEHALRWLRRDGWNIVTLDDCLDGLLNDDRTQRYAVLTFDDGYRDNVSVALPILERYNAPFTIYVPTGSPTRGMESWWLGLRELFRSQQR